MDPTLIYLSLIIIVITLLINLTMTLKIQMELRQPPSEPSLTSSEVGQRITLPKGSFLQGGKTISLDNNGQASVLLFLSSRCPKCRQTLPELESLLPVARDAGLNIWLVSHESRRRLETFLGSFFLRTAVFRISLWQYRKLNPTFSSPFYLFVDHENKLEAAGTIGDRNWQAFLRQMESIETDMDSVAYHGQPL